MCDRCVDKIGVPSVDLRDFPQPVFEVDDEEALDFVTGLVDPDPERKAAARRVLPAQWLRFSNGDLFETVMAFASGFTMDPSSSKHAQGRVKKPEHFARITPDMLALAGRAIIGGDAGFAALADRYRLDVDRRPSFYGRRKELGPLAYVPYDKHIEPKIRKLVDELVDADMARSAGSGTAKVRRAEYKGRRVLRSPDDGFLNIAEFAKQFGLRRKRLQRFADSGYVRVLRASNAERSPVRMAVADVLPLIMLLPDTIGPDAAAGLLGLPGHALPALAGRKLIERLDGPILGFMPRKEGYRRSSIQELARRIRKRAATPVPASATRMSRAVRSIDRPVAPWDAVISAIVDGDVEVYAYPARRLNVRNGLAVADIPSFVKAVTKHMPKRSNKTQVEWVGANTVSEILKVTEIFVYRLAERRPDLLKRKRNGYTPFLLADVQTIAKDYIFVPEICERGGGHGRRMCRWLRDRGVEPKIQLQDNRDFGFRRREVERHLTEQAAVHARRIAELAKAPDNERTRLIRAVEAGTPTHVAAKSVGMPYKRALLCIDRWRDTGDWMLGKGGFHSPLDQHEEWLRDLIAKDPQLSLAGICKALKDERQVSTNDGSLLKWLDRQGIALARRRRAPLSDSARLLAAE
jgi:transposase